jgi:hypothetical protein
MRIIPIHPIDTLDAEPTATNRQTPMTPSRRTLGVQHPSRRTLGTTHPSRRTLGTTHPSRRTLGVQHP